MNKKKDIQVAAVSAFSRNGYAETKILDIAEESGVSVGTIYKYYKSKKELFESLKQPELKKIHPSFDATRHKILIKASKHFAENGYTDTTMDNISQLCGFSKATLYRYFTSKEELFSAIVLETSTIIDFKVCLDPDKDIEQVLCDLAMQYIRMLIEPNRINLIKMRLNASNKIPRKYSDIINKCINIAHSSLADYLHIMSEKGVIRQTNIEQAADLFLNTLFSYVVEEKILKNHKSSSIETYSKGIANIFLHGLS